MATHEERKAVQNALFNRAYTMQVAETAKELDRVRNTCPLCRDHLVRIEGRMHCLTCHTREEPCEVRPWTQADNGRMPLDRP